MNTENAPTKKKYTHEELHELGIAHEHSHEYPHDHPHDDPGALTRTGFAGCRMAAGIFFARSGAFRLHFGRTARIITHIF